MLYSIYSWFVSRNLYIDQSKAVASILRTALRGDYNIDPLPVQVVIDPPSNSKSRFFVLSTLGVPEHISSLVRPVYCLDEETSIFVNGTENVI